MSTYKLTYFNFRGRAEVTRFLFALAEVDYEDERFERDEWVSRKYKNPFGQVPTLEVDGKVLCQSHVIESYLSRKFGFSGQTDFDQARCDMIVASLEDCLVPLIACRREENEDLKKVMVKKYCEETFPGFMEKFVKLVQDNGHFVGDKITLADVAFYHYTTQMGVFLQESWDWDKWPKLKAVRDAVTSNDKIAAWIAKRPETSL